MLKYSLVVLFIVNRISNGQAIAEDNGVLLLNSGNFNEAKQKFEYLFVDFFMNWCGPCQQLAPLWAQAARQVRSSRVQFGKVDCEESRDLCAQQQISGFPSMRLFNGDQTVDYNAGRSPRELVDFINKRIVVVSNEINTQSELDLNTRQNNIVLIYFGVNKDQQQFINFQNYARMNLDSLKFLYTFNKDLLQKQNIDDDMGLILYRQFDERKLYYSGDYSIDSITYFIEKNYYPTVLQFDYKVSSKIFGETTPTLFLFQHQNQQSLKAEKNLRLSVPDIKDKVKICIAKSDDHYGRRLIQYLNIDQSKLPLLIIVEPQGKHVNQIYFEQEIVSENIINFIQNYSSIKTTHSNSNNDRSQVDDL